MIGLKKWLEWPLTSTFIRYVKLVLLFVKKIAPNGQKNGYRTKKDIMRKFSV